MNSNPSIADFLPEFELVRLNKLDGTPSDAYAKVLGFDDLNAIVQQGTSDMIAFGCRLLALACVRQDGTPLGTEADWKARATFKAKDRLLDLITQVGEVNGVLSKTVADDLGNGSKPTGGSDSSSSSVSGSDAPAESCEKL